jgi:hypothetical protein
MELLVSRGRALFLLGSSVQVGQRLLATAVTAAAVVGTCAAVSRRRQQRRVVACGRGRDICHPVIRDEIIALSGKPQPTLLYLGTPSFESVEAFAIQTQGFRDLGCAVTELRLTDPTDTPSGTCLHTRSNSISNAHQTFCMVLRCVTADVPCVQLG